MIYIQYIPVLTTLFSVYFIFKIGKHFAAKPEARYLLWWTIGIITYGMGTITESINAMYGWTELNQKVWYVVGALMGGAPLAQGTVYLLMPRKAANILTFLLITVITVAAVFVFLSPVDHSMVVDGRLSGKVLSWQWVRYFSPFINTYALIFLFGGAVLSAWKYYKNRAMRRFLGNVYIAIGALLPGIGGSFTRFGYVDVLYVTELLGLLCMFTGYMIIRTDKSISLHVVQKETAGIA